MRMSGERLPRPLNSGELPLLRWMLGLLVGMIAVTSVFHLDLGMEWQGTLALVLLGVAVFRPIWFRSVPGWLQRVAALLIVGVSLYQAFAVSPVSGLVHLNFWLLVYRSLAERKRREDMQFLLLCLFLLIITGVLTASALFGVQLMLFAGAAVAFLFLSNLIENEETGHPSPPDEWRSKSLVPLLGRLFHASNWGVLCLGASVYLLVLIISGLFFITIPRISLEHPLPGWQNLSGGTLTGFSDSITLGDVTAITNDTSIAMRVDVSDPYLFPEIPYWRMVVLDEYQNGTFRLSPVVREQAGRNVLTGRSIPNRRIREDFSGTGLELTLFLERGISRFLPLPGDFQEIRLREESDIYHNLLFGTYSLRRNSPGVLSLQVSGVIPSATFPDHEAMEQRLVASAYSEWMDLYGAGTSVGMPPGMSFPETLLALPLLSEEVEFLRGRLRQLDLPERYDAVGFSREVVWDLERRHSYSMQVTLPPAARGISDPVIRWMQSGSSGHCEFFAGAFILMARAAGYPARAVTGFKGGSWNAFENYFMVRNSDAHAWVEIYDGVDSWLRVDPTPGSELPDRNDNPSAARSMISEENWDDSMSAYLDSMRMLWYRRFMGFDETMQARMRSRLADTGHTIVSLMKELGQSLRYFIQSWTEQPRHWLAHFIPFLVVFFIFAAVFFLSRLLRRWIRRWRYSGRRQNPVRREAGWYLRQLQRKEFLRCEMPVAATGTEGDLMAQLMCLRYGPPSNWPIPYGVFEQARLRLRGHRRLRSNPVES